MLKVGPSGMRLNIALEALFKRAQSEGAEPEDLALVSKAIRSVKGPKDNHEPASKRDWE